METLRSWNEHERTLGPSRAQTNYIVYFGIFWTILAANVTLLIGWLVAAWLLFFILGPARGILGLLTSIQALELSFFFQTRVAPKTRPRRDPVEQYYAPVVPFYFFGSCH